MGTKTTTAKSRKVMEERGYTVATVEWFNYYTQRRHDLYQLFDLLCIKKGETVAVQTTSASNISSRIRKITDHENTPVVREAGWKILVHGWKREKNGRYSLREEDVS